MKWLLHSSFHCLIKTNTHCMPNAIELFLEESVSFTIESLSHDISYLDFSINSIKISIDYIEDREVTLRKFNQLKNLKQELENKINQLIALNVRFKQMIDETEPFREPLTVVKSNA